MKNTYILILLCSALLLQACKTTERYKLPKENENEVYEIESVTPPWLGEEAPYQASSKRENDILHMKLEVSFDWEKQHVLGKSQLVVRPYFYPQNTLKLDARGFDIHRVEMRTISNTTIPLQYTYDSSVLIITLDKTYNRDEKYMVEVDYTAKPNELESGGSAAITEDKGLYFINPLGEDKEKPQQIWTQGETQANSAWFPIIDRPNEKISQEIYITIDTNFTTLSNGLLVYSKTNSDGTKTEYWKQDKPHPVYLVMLAIGEFAVVKDEWEGMEVSYYVEKEYEEFADDIFGNTPEMLEYFSKILKYRYPWDKYSQVVVRDFVSGAMENTTATVMMESVQSTDRELIDENWDGIIAHELFHHWFGDLVTCESWANLPLNESFANYAEYLWDEYKYGKDEADLNAYNEMQGYMQEARSKREPLIRYNYKTQEDMFDGHSYNKGGRILHMLRNYVGDEAFFNSLSVYLKKKEYQTAEVHDLRMAFEEVTGEDLNWFFNQWFLSRGHPALDVTHSYDSTSQQLTVSVTQAQNMDHQPLYRIPTKIGYWVNGELTVEEVEVNDEHEGFVFKAKEKPQTVLFDVDQIILGQVGHEKTKEEFLAQYKYGPNYLSRHHALEGVLEQAAWAMAEVQSDTEKDYHLALDDAAARNALLEATEDKAWGIRYNALRLFSGYAGEGKGDLYFKAEQMATNDPNTTVMAEAIKLLGETVPDKYERLFKSKLGHKSLYVESEALFAYLKTTAADKGEVLAEYSDSESADIVAVVSDYYATEPKPEYNSWFLEKVSDKGHLFYDVIINYSNYLVVLEDETLIQSGIKTFENIAMDKELGMWHKLAAFQALGTFADRKEVEQLRNQIKENETDEGLKYFYSLFP